MKVRALLLLAALVAPMSISAAERNDLPSCYAKAHLEDFHAPASGRLLNVVIDQTIPMPDDIQRAAWGNIERFVQPGDQIKLYSFSAFVPGQYVRLLYSGTLDSPIAKEQRDDINMNKLRTFDACFSKQRTAFINSFGRQFVGALRDAKQDLPKSEIMFALREVGKDQSKSSAHDRIIFLISDMLEHSDYTSFYAANKIRDLKPTEELAKAEKNDLLADLGGAKVFVEGAGLVTDAIKHDYRSGHTMDLLEQFWRGYIAKSNAELSDFGKPMLNVDLH
jgi:hypothetical protein